MNKRREAWVRQSDAQEERKRLSKALKGWWKLARPFKAWSLYCKLRATSEASRKAANERFLRKRLADAALANLNADQRRAVISPGSPHPHRRRDRDRQDPHDGRESPGHRACRDRASA